MENHRIDYQGQFEAFESVESTQKKKKQSIYNSFRFLVAVHLLPGRPLYDQNSLITNGISPHSRW